MFFLQRRAARFAGATVFFCCLAPMGVMAQTATTGGLTTYVTGATATGITPLQVASGIAVQQMCNYLTASTTSGGLGLSQNSTAAQLATGAGDLFLRCNEMVNTANRVLGNGGTVTRALTNDGSVLNNVLQQVAGEEVTTPGVLATRAVSGQFANITGRLAVLRIARNSSRPSVEPALSSADSLLASTNLPAGSGAMLDNGARVPQSGFGSSGYGGAAAQNVAMYAPNVGNGAQGQFSLTDSATGGGGDLDRPWGWFADGSYDSGKRKQTLNEDPFNYHASVLTLGVDYNFGAGVAGASLGYDSFKSDIRGSGLAVSPARTELTSKGAAVFGAFDHQKWSFNGILNYAALTSTLTRAVNYTTSTGAGATCTGGSSTLSCGANRQFRGTPDGRSLAAGVTASYQGQAGDWNLTPSLSANTRHVNIDSFSETELSPPAGGGGLALSYGSQSIDSVRSVLALDLARSFSQNFGVFTPTFGVQWQHEFRDKPRLVSARYSLDSTGSIAPFLMPTDRPDVDIGVVSAGASFLFSGRLQAYVNVQQVIASQLTATSVALGVRGQF